MVHSVATLRALGKENAPPAQTVLRDALDAKVTPGKKEWRIVGGLATPEEGIRRVKRVAAQVRILSSPRLFSSCVLRRISDR